eukprot:SAG31_NODE_12100_length_968_cov_1.430380_2_plen_263_part_00
MLQLCLLCGSTCLWARLTVPASLTFWLAGCRPIMLQLWSIVCSRWSFVGSTVAESERNHPNVVEEMLASSVKLLPIGADGACRTRSGKLVWAPRGSAAAASISGADGASTWGEPYCAELPAAMLELIKTEPNGAVGQSYQRYVRMALLPGVRMVGELLRQHGATIGAPADFLRLPTAVLLLIMVRANHVQPTLWHAEWPPLTWLKEMHPARGSVEVADAHAHVWLAYMRALEVLLVAWDQEVFVDMVPGQPLPLSGMMACIE